MNRKINKYIKTWMGRGYPDDIPDSVPDSLMSERLAPSYRAVCLAILRNDAPMESLGFSPRKSPYYVALKRMEIEARVCVTENPAKGGMG